METQATSMRYVAALASLVVLVFSWVTLPTNIVTVTWPFLIAGTLAGVCGMLGTLLFPHGASTAYAMLWSASSFLLALAIPTLMTIGLLYLIAAALIFLYLIRMPSVSGRAWWCPRYLGIGLLVFTVTEWTLFILTLPGHR